MASTTFVLGLLVASIAAWAAWDMLRALRIARRLRGDRIVTCPETGRAAAVAIDVGHAVTTGLTEHAPTVRLRTCSRWAERGRCDEPCIAEAQELSSTTPALVERTLSGKPCAFCARPIARASYLDHHAALLDAGGLTTAWTDIPPELLRDALSTRSPVCWDCHIAETFRRTYPALVTDRPWRSH